MSQLSNNRASLPLNVIAEGETFAERLEWIRDQQAALQAQLLDHGALRFVEIGSDGVERFDQLSARFFERALSYVGGDSPRTKLSERVYTSTEFPAEYAISLHNELSYANQWPKQLLFCCAIPAEEGGETPLADSREILQKLDARIADQFIKRGVCYIRNLHGGFGFGRSWQETFETEDRGVLEQHCRETETEYTWRSDGSVHLVQRRAAVAKHPLTGELVWFNQADQYHPTNNPPALRESISRMYGDDPDELPMTATFGDGETIPDEILAEVRAVIARATKAFTWLRGDALLLDNMLVCHGRNPFRGNRKILVSMA